MDNILFQIKGLKCKYPKSQWPVLEISELNIPVGEIVFFVGSSGVGKSTILETLGLMNNTISSNGATIFNYTSGNNAKSIGALWQKGENELASFRRKHLSFIFQSTNLFNNLTAFENVCLSQIVQGKSREKAELDAKRMLKRMFKKDNVPDEELILKIIQGKKVTELSGGQRQRLAFVRAVITDYNVLLADEPTGNLDWGNAHNLMKVLVENVREKGKTAIIVTHDINLALEYGDRVVLIQKRQDPADKKRVFGLIDASSIYTKQNGTWQDVEQEKLESGRLAEYLKSQLA